MANKQAPHVLHARTLAMDGLGAPTNAAGAANPHGAPGAGSPAPPLHPDHALFLDVDGTLFDFCVDPSTTRASRGQLELLSRVGSFLGGALALVSGRTLGMLDRIFEPMKPVACGLHGLQLRGLPGLPDAAAHVPTAGFNRVVAEAQRLFAACPGVFIEDKRTSLGLHWRGAPEAASQLLAFARDAVQGLDGYRLQSGNHVVEIRPTGPDKGDGIETIMQRAPFAGRVPVFVGDDLTDEPGFAAVNARGGISILVGDRAGSAARHALAAPSAVWTWMEGVP